MCVYVGNNLIIWEFESWITGVCSPCVFICVICLLCGRVRACSCYGRLCSSAFRIMFVKILLVVCM